MFGDSGDGQKVRAVATGAAITCAGATVLGLGAARYAEIEAPLPKVESVANAPVKTIDYATTGSVGGETRHEVVVLNPCRGQVNRR